MRIDLRRFLLVFLTSVLVLSGEALAQKSPLIMKHADSLAVARKRGSLLLQGRVHFIHDSIDVRTQRATWNKDGEVVACEGGFQFTHPSGWIDAKQGIYQKKKGVASATGDVHAGDSAHTYYATGEYVVYDKENEILTMPDKPKLYYYDKKDSVKEGKSVNTVDTVTVVARRIVYNKKDSFAEGYGDASITHKEVSIKADEMTYDRKIDYARGVGNVVITHDSVTVYADRMNYNKKDDFAEAFNHVKVVQEDMVVTCDTGYFDRKNNWMSMKGNPKCELKNYNLTGDSIFLTLDSTGKSLKSALVIRNAHGVQEEDAKKSSPGSVTEAFGDTLYAQFDGNKIERLYVNLNARGFFYEKDLDNYRNNMNGDRLDMYFENGKMHHAVVSGKAQSTYYYVKKDRSVSGRNEAAGDTIFIKFDPRKNAVKTLRMLGGSSTPSSGRYVDMEKENRKQKELADAKIQKELAETGKQKKLTERVSGNDIKSDAKKDSVEKTEETSKGKKTLKGISEKFKARASKAASQENKK